MVFQAQHERNYHIFYQLCSQFKNKDYAYLKLCKQSLIIFWYKFKENDGEFLFSVPSSEFFYTNQGQADEIDNVNDSDVFRETLDAFKLLDVNKNDQMVIFSLISAILHLGNVKIVNERSNESSVVSVIKFLFHSKCCLWC